MSSGLSDDSEHSWVLDLENSLLEECSAADIYCICKGKSLPKSLRPEIWKICLDLKDREDQISKFNQIYDLTNQALLREDCRNIIAKLSCDKESEVTILSDLESVLTFYCKSRNFTYNSNNGWIDILLPLVSLRISRTLTYNLFEAIRDTYISQNCNEDSCAFHIFRLLLLYHEPELCSFLDTKKIPPQAYCLKWFQSLFASTCQLEVVINMWDYYFQQSDPFFIFFLSLIMVINARDQVLSMRSESRDFIINKLATMPHDLQPEDVEDFCSLAQYYAFKTPMSIRTDYMQRVYSNDYDEYIGQALCLPVSVQELWDNCSIKTAGIDTVRFFLVDCRPVEQYNAGHLPTAFHLDCNLMLQEPVAFATAIQGLLSSQKQALLHNSDAGGEHLCFLGSGRNEEDQYTHMIVASFLQRHTQYVSMVQGGYTALHHYFGDNVDIAIEDHNFHKCIVCAPVLRTKSPSTSSTASPNPTTDIFGKITAAMKSKSAEMKGKLLDYIVNPNSVGNRVKTDSLQGLSTRTETNRMQRVPVFSIDDDHDSTANISEYCNVEITREQMSLQTCTAQADYIGHFPCQEVKMNGTLFKSYLVLAENELSVLRCIGKKKDIGEIVIKRPLSAVVKITAHKKHPQLITFKYGYPDGDQLNISDMDKFLIPDADVAIKIISDQILKHMKNNM